MMVECRCSQALARNRWHTDVSSSSSVPPLFSVGVGGCLLLLLGLLAALFYAMATLRTIAGDGWYVALFLAGALFGGVVVAGWHMAAAATGATYWFTGSEAEQWTGKELERLGPGWRVLHGIPLTAGSDAYQYEVDVDHIAVGPTGVLVVETKYHSSALDLGAERLEFQLKRDAEQANRNAQRVRNLLRDVVPVAPVMPVLVYWGRLVASPVGDVRRLGPVQVVHGRKAKQWIPVVIDRPQELDSDLIESIVARLEERASPTSA